MTQAAKYNSNHCWRLAFVLLYLGIAILIFYICSGKMFYLMPTEDFNGYRFSWCVLCSTIGFATIAFAARNHPKSPFPSYVTYYPLMIIAFSALVFAICHSFDSTSGFVFYYMSAPLCFFLSYKVDDSWRILESWLRKA